NLSEWSNMRPDSSFFGGKKPMKRSRAAASLAAFALSVFCVSSAAADDDQQSKEPTKLPETVVTADRIEVPPQDTGRLIDLRTNEDFHDQETSSLNDTLQTVPGVRSENLGGPGSPGTTPIEIRGFRSSGTQLLLNNMRLNDPSSISGIADSYFAYIT